MRSNSILLQLSTLFVMETSLEVYFHFIVYFKRVRSENNLFGKVSKISSKMSFCKKVKNQMPETLLNLSS